MVKDLACYGFVEHSGAILLHSLGESPEMVRENMLENCLGWRYEHPDRYNHDESWQRLLKTGEVVELEVITRRR